jgi:hypothetical protein
MITPYVCLSYKVICLFPGKLCVAKQFTSLVTQGVCATKRYRLWENGSLCVTTSWQVWALYSLRTRHVQFCCSYSVPSACSNRNTLYYTQTIKVSLSRQWKVCSNEVSAFSKRVFYNYLHSFIFMITYAYTYRSFFLSDAYCAELLRTKWAQEARKVTHM